MNAAPLSCRCEDFSLPADLHYLNCAYMGPLPRVVQDAGFEGVRRKADPSRITARDFFDESDRVRALFAQLIGATDPQRIALIPAASYGIAAAARNTATRRGQSVVISGEQFPSNVYSWRELCRRRGLQLRTVSRREGHGQEWNASILEAIDADTAIVALPHVHWTDGTLFDLVAIGRRARAVGAALIVDGTQSIGALPFDLAAVQPDALVVAAYKWLLGPYSTGAAYYGSRYDDGEPLEENWITRKGSDDFRALVAYADEYQPVALRYDVGERSNFALLPMLVASLELILDWTPERIQHYCAALIEAPLQEIADLGYRVEAAEWRSAHLFGIRMPASVDLARLNAELQHNRVFASMRGSALRVSPNVYNTPEDMTALVDVLRNVTEHGPAVP